MSLSPLNVFGHASKNRLRNLTCVYYNYSCLGTILERLGDTGMAGWGVGQATAVANHVAAERGLQARLLRFGSNGLFALGDKMVLRVSPSNRRVERGLRFARVAAAHGLPVLQPISETVTVIAGLKVTEWPHIKPVDRPVDYHWLGTVACQIHDSSANLARACSLDLAHNELGATQLQKVRTRLDILYNSGLFSKRSVNKLEQRYQRLAEQWAATVWDKLVVLHGDLYAGNVLTARSGSVLIDFDQVAVGPRAWDQVPVEVQVRRFGLNVSCLTDFAHGYGTPLDNDPGYELLVQFRELASATWVAALSLERSGLMPEVKLRLATLSSESDSEIPWKAVM